MKMEERQEIMMKAYWQMWVSADFDSDFQKDYPNTYKKMQDGNHYQISVNELINIRNYLRTWTLKKVFKNF